MAQFIVNKIKKDAIFNMTLLLFYMTCAPALDTINISINMMFLLIDGLTFGDTLRIFWMEVTRSLVYRDQKASMTI